MKYFICNNRDSPYCVELKKNQVTVYSTFDFSIVYQINSPIKTFIGKSISDNAEVVGKKWNGSTILVQVDDLKYIHISSRIREFKTSEPVIKYISNIGNNLVPYSYAVTKNFIYLLEYNVIITRNELVNQPQKDPYAYYHSFNCNMTRKCNFKEFKTKIIIGHYKYRCPMYYYLINGPTNDMKIEINVLKHFNMY